MDPTSPSPGSSALRGAAWALVLLLGTAGCAAGPPGEAPPDGEPAGFLDEPLGPWPQLLSEIDFEERGESYEPAWPLWSNGSSKDRWLVLPPGEQVDRTSPDRWLFPEGTILFKTFSFDRPVETRALRLTEEGWDYAAWLWRPDGSDAELLEGSFATPIEGYEHTVPATFECRSCHEVAPSAVLGYSAVQLDPEHAIDAVDAQDRAVLGFFEGNCVHCHSAASTLEDNLLDLRWQHAFDEIVGQPVQGSGQLPGIRVVPGQPEQSILFLAVSLELDDPELKPMPPVGVEVLDEAAIEELRAWILSLEAL